MVRLRVIETEDSFAGLMAVGSGNESPFASSTSNLRKDLSSEGTGRRDPGSGASSPGRQPNPAYRCFAIAKTETTAPVAAFAQSVILAGR
jgi:hypothetical protein